MTRVLTRMNLWKRNIIGDLEKAKCVLYSKETETTEHLILTCDKSVLICNLVYAWVDFVVVMPADVKSHFLQHRDPVRRKR